MAQSEIEREDLIPVPEDPFPQQDQCRLWIGNIDPKITEFTILKLLQKFGQLVRFDFLYHKSGPDKGKSRGYCFVSYSTKEEATKALRKVNGKFALTKKLVVRWAHIEPDTSIESKKKAPQTVVTKPTEHAEVSIHSKIKEIEAKLHSMKKSQSDFSISTEINAVPGTSKLSAVNIISNTKRNQNYKPYDKSSSRAHHNRKR
ncbi:hypothetical protein SNE40_001331 [Patella caerulea]|uniref:Probable RNA-binding protein 18 n=1 Tax=Patella caerulea TaxID=87958 RepID=A0AAN8KIG0_PATCE